jgi:TRAP-type C4-dicarboxylate transport system permease small subunit
MKAFDFKTIDMLAIRRVLKTQTPGSWSIIAVLLALLAATVVVAYLGWTSAPDTMVPASGYVALTIGVVFSLVVGFGLMALVFYSSRHGYDEPAKPLSEGAPDSAAPPGADELR